MKIEDLYQIVLNGGYDAEEKISFKIKDAVATPDSAQNLNKVYTTIVQEAVQMQMVGERLLRTVRHNNMQGESITYRWLGAGNIPNVDRAEGGEYPEFSLAGGQNSVIKAQFLQRGLVVKITQEQIEQSQWDVVSAHITEAARALARAKEKLIFDVIESSGVVVFDNDNPAGSIKGECTGRDIYGVKNGAITQENLFDMYCQGLANGYNPDVILVHPLAFPIFQKDPVLREAGYSMYNPRAFINSQLNPINSYSNKTIDGWRKQQRAVTGAGSRLTDKEIELTSTGFPQLPSFSPLAGMTIIASHFVPLDVQNQTTSIIMLDTSATAIMNVKQPLTVDSWDEITRKITAVRISESYSIDVIDKGLGILVAKNVPLVPNELNLNPQVVINDLT